MKKYLFLILLLVVSCVSQEVVISENIVDDSPIEVGSNIGDLAPGFSLLDVDGNEVSLASFDRPVIVYFFATWCPYCSQDLTTLSVVYSDYSDDIAIVASSLDLDEDADLIKQYQEKYSGLDEVIFAPGIEDMLKSYNVRFTTSKYAVNSEGKIIYAGSGPFTEKQWITLFDLLKNS